MDALVAATLPHGLVPPVIMEFPGITVGDGFAGTGCESSSFRHRYFDRTVMEIETVTGDGEVLRARRGLNEGLWRGTACAFGTLGVVTLLEVQLVEASEFVEVEYVPVHDMEHMLFSMQLLAEAPETEFLEAIMFSLDKFVVCVGNKAPPESKAPVQRFARARDPWYYLHVQKQLLKLPRPPLEVQCVPLTDYLFRYDRGAFWTGRWAFLYFLVPFTAFFRWLLDYFMHTRIMYHALHESGYSNTWILQDAVIPFDKAEEFVKYVHKAFVCYPLWLCPIQQRGTDPGANRGLLAQKPRPGPLEMMLNVGIYTGIESRNHDHFVDMNRKLERKIFELGGEKWLYAHTFYTEDEFWQLLDRKEYDALRENYHATHLPTMYEKVKMKVPRRGQKMSWSEGLSARFWLLWPFAGLYGISKALLASDYLLPERHSETASQEQK